MGNLETILSPSCVCKNKYNEEEEMSTQTKVDDGLNHTRPTDPRLPLTEMQIFKLKKSWKGIHREMIPTGVEMFIR